MSEAQELFDLTWPYLNFIAPVIFLLAVFACVDLIYTLLVNFMKKARIRW